MYDDLMFIQYPAPEWKYDEVPTLRPWHHGRLFLSTLNFFVFIEHVCSVFCARIKKQVAIHRP